MIGIGYLTAVATGFAADGPKHNYIIHASYSHVNGGFLKTYLLFLRWLPKLPPPRLLPKFCWIVNLWVLSVNAPVAPTNWICIARPVIRKLHI